MEVSKNLPAIIIIVLVSASSFGQSPLADQDSKAFVGNYVGIELTELAYNAIVSTAIRGVSSHQYFGKRNWSPGSITYNGISYTNLEILFDLEYQQIIIKHPRGGRSDGIAPDMALIDEFVIDGHSFRRHQVGGTLLFCDELFIGTNFTYIADRKKKAVAKQTGPELSSSTDYYLISEGQPYLVKGRSSAKKMPVTIESAMQTLRALGFRLAPRDESRSVVYFQKLDSLIDSAR